MKITQLDDREIGIINSIQESVTGKKIENAVEILVRKDDNGYTHSLIPVKFLEKTIELLKKNKINYDAVRADSRDIRYLRIQESRYSVEEYSESEVYAFLSSIKLDELYELIDYLDKLDDKTYVKLRFYKNSELPEYQKLLDEEACARVDDTIKTVLYEYMKLLIDMEVSEALANIINLIDTGKIGHLLRYYTKDVQELVISRSSLRTQAEIREALKKLCK